MNVCFNCNIFWVKINKEIVSGHASMLFYSSDYTLHKEAFFFIAKEMSLDLSKLIHNIKRKKTKET